MNLTNFYYLKSNMMKFRLIKNDQFNMLINVEQNFKYATGIE